MSHDNIDFHYNFVFFLADNDYQKICYSSLFGNKHAQIVYNWNLGKVTNFIHRIHMSPKINAKIKLPFKKIWYKKYFHPHFHDKKPMCFVFDTCLVKVYSFLDYIKYLRLKYPNSVFVLFYQDLIGTFPQNFVPNSTRVFFDLVISYDKGDAENNNLLYHPTVASYVDIDCAGVSSDYKSDVYCIAQAKDRLSTFLGICDYLMSNGIKCKFFLSKVPEKNRVKHDGVFYLDKPMSYMENLKFVLNTKCILEIMQKGAVGYTLRLWEAILYDKKLLTNNVLIKDSSFYDNRYISVMQLNENGYIVDVDFIMDQSQFVNPYKSKVTPSNLMVFIEDCLNRRSQNNL